MNTMPAAALNESATLRALDLPHSRKQWLRDNLPSIPTSGGLIYEAAAVQKLKARLAENRSAVLSDRSAGKNIHTR